eukprot:TRINITY_DN11174_c0_g2_i1.p1 TRINITY_DN11174_c0_g2~~TRINITY_DN11174_c0_g2_i1.p1  ORF type:complete len:113 (-),score=10.18 TRINITY_DN11174_c0_g2_i1:231-569(-)
MVVVSLYNERAMPHHGDAVAAAALPAVASSSTAVTSEPLYNPWSTAWHWCLQPQPLNNRTRLPQSVLQCSTMRLAEHLRSSPTWRAACCVPEHSPSLCNRRSEMSLTACPPL